jgi:hypothetical protein
MKTDLDQAAGSSRKTLAKGIGLLALAGTIVPPALNMLGRLADGPMQQIMLASAVAWFVAAPFWMDVD